jgi:uroporphyrinogen-III synthase
MHILVTRPDADAAELRIALEAQGHEVIVEPLLAIETLPAEAKVLEGACGVIATSRNSLRALAENEALTAAKELPLFCVGPATTELARTLGFQRIIAGEGSASELVPLILGSKVGKKGYLVHVSGEEIALDLVGKLGARGIEVRRLAVYRAVAANTLRPQTARAIANRWLDAVILMSPRTAEIFTDLVDKAGLQEPARRLAYVCLSANVAGALKGLDPARVNIAVRPNSSGILEAIGQVATHSSGV